MGKSSCHLPRETAVRHIEIGPDIVGYEADHVDEPHRQEAEHHRQDKGTGVFLHNWDSMVAASDRAALNSDEIAARAEAELEGCAGKRGEYGLFSNNCHAFTRYCITGERSTEGAFGEAEIEAALESVFKTQVVWIPMGRG